MARSKTSRSNPEPELTAEAPDSKAARPKTKPALTALLADISKMSEDEQALSAKGGSTLLMLDQAMRATAAGHTKIKTSKAGSQMTVNQVERSVPMTADEEKRGAAPPMLPLPSNVMALPSADRREKLRIVEALLFAASAPLHESVLARHFAEGEDVKALLEELQGLYAGRGVNLVRVAGKWAFRTADDLSFLLERQAVEQRRLSRAALETLAIIAYHQPVTRAEIEEVRGVSTSKGTIDVLLETGWIKLRGRRRAPGRPVTYGTTEAFLEHFGFETIQDLPGLSELKGAGLLDSNLPPGFTMPSPDDASDLRDDEEPLEDEPLGAGEDEEDEGTGPDSSDEPA
jgi:segregation and condensation protein B